jgi:hypothetical protein
VINQAVSFDLTSFIVGALVGALVAVGLAVPRAGRIFCTIIAVALLVCGIGFLTLAISLLISGDELRPIGWWQFSIASPWEALALGSGVLVGGILLLVLPSPEPNNRRGGGGVPPVRL